METESEGELVKKKIEPLGSRNMASELPPPIITKRHSSRVKTNKCKDVLQTQHSQIVKLNVGGGKFMTTYTTLASHGKNALTALVDNVHSGRVTSTIDEDNYLFIDRCGVIFSGVLNYLRTGVLIPPTGITREQLLIELDFFSINIYEEGHDAPGKKLIRLDRQKIRDSLQTTITENEDNFIKAMRDALSDGENCLDIIPAISYNLEPDKIVFKRESGFNKLFGSQVRDELFLDELCAQLENIFGCPVVFGVKELRNFTDGTRAKVITVDLGHFLPHQNKNASK